MACLRKIIGEPEYFKVNEKYFSGQIDTTKKLADFKQDMKALDVGAVWVNV
jgi:hypothetical protein